MIKQLTSADYVCSLCLLYTCTVKKHDKTTNQSGLYSCPLIVNERKHGGEREREQHATKVPKRTVSSVTHQHQKVQASFKIDKKTIEKTALRTCFLKIIVIKLIMLRLVPCYDLQSLPKYS